MYRRFFKRLIDFFAALCGLIILSPPLVQSCGFEYLNHL